MTGRAMALLLMLAGGAAAVDAQSTTFVRLDSADGVGWMARKLTLVFDDVALLEGVREIARQGELRLTYDPSLPGLDRRLTMTLRDVTVRAALDRVLSHSPITARVSATGQLVLVARTDDDDGAGNRPVVRGSVRTPEGAPIENARVDLVGTRFAAYTRKDGTFSLGQIPAGSYTLRASQIGTRPDVRAGFSVPSDRTSTELTLAPVPIPLAEMVVSPAYYGLMQTGLASPRVLDRVQLQTTPQIGEDIYRAMSRLPGVAADDYSAKFSVRGASGDEMYVTLDGLPLIEPFHLRDIGNALSIVDIQMLMGAELIAGGAPTQYGNHTGSVLTMETVSPRTDRTRASVGLSIMNARTLAEGGFASGKGGWLLSARRGYVDIAFKLAGIKDSIQPRYYDLYGKVEYDVGPMGRISLHALVADDHTRYSSKSDPQLTSSYASNFLWARWRGALGARLEQETVASLASLSWQRDATDFANTIQRLMLDDTRSLSRLQLRHDLTATINQRVLFKGGVELWDQHGAYDYFSWLRREQFESVGKVGVSYDTTRVAVSPRGTTLGAHLSARVRPATPLTVEGGIRYDRVSHSGDALLSPRVHAAWQPGRSTTVKAAWGRHGEPQPLQALQVQDGETRFRRADVADQLELGLEQQLPKGVSLHAQAYERTTSQHGARWISASSSINLVPELSYDRRVIFPNVGRARGLETSLGRDRSSNMDWNVVYALARVTDDVNGVTIPRSVDQRHAVNLDWAVHPRSNRWRLTVAGMWHSGWPYTPEIPKIDTVENTAQRFVIFAQQQLGLINSARAPSYSRVDARWTRYFDTRRGRVTLFAEVFNLLDHHNVRGQFGNVFVNGRSVTVNEQARTSIGRLPSIGFNWEF